MKVGDFELDVFSAGRYRLDGGAMFGIIPKPLWERLIPPDEKNRIELDTCCVLVRTGGQQVLIETGCGDKFNEKEREIYQFEPGVTIESALGRRGVDPASMDLVVLTHLHFDHAGGATKRDASGRVIPTFPRATYVVQGGEWEDARNNFGVMKTTYRPENFEPIREAGRLRLVEGDLDLCPGIRLLVTRGHTRHHMSVQIESRGETVLFTSDLIPTRSHLRGPYVMAYDLYPQETMTRKLDILAQAEAGGWRLVWSHEPFWRMGRVVKSDRGEFAAQEVKMMSG
ncbi:MAG: MBL fold metallo-hydrolase [Planctomycetes bacterium]|nr:MBL fold metallo-hydrolase [Planctomycetota bacterium]